MTTDEKIYTAAILAMMAFGAYIVIFAPCKVFRYAVIAQVPARCVVIAE